MGSRRKVGGILVFTNKYFVGRPSLGCNKYRACNEAEPRLITL